MKTIVLILIAIFFWICSFAQDEKPYFIGIQPGITVEPFYPEGEFDVNIIPVVFLMPLSQRVDFRATLVVNYHLGGNEQISDVGIQTVWPIYINKKEAITNRSRGMFLGPVIGFGYNFLNKHTTLTAALEPGYFFEANRNFTLSIGIQLGASYFKYDDGKDKWQNHWGPKINLGWWF